ncbi:bifunctional DnaQ family exonuclease/ATP-dependent helicase [Streptococcus vestibularis]|uniref:bifunctional DnaQ family exonuclease/ATP-dependent helicase n=1 Tax=Streptococcus vestibularis TaxID=1343 RepID=UPI002330D722|nr:bifunctional DnaQ family exonuclease/ATP-dependent helicase [Streptococcus vestibularis]MDB6184663.1 bifunctional DnaQ family exonuclease/ATP-dependent helicase [Streptococcus vestibularis]MDB6201296.1 bifunctional DnaQ family exonuclease/ATP-dependent helicase [Streptococcus vestibularis]MDB6208609.1 bifunctional DnaQ family exonuclease/ATP-dependent helicase [Streptococcus vestibularis]MDB6211458.1 bifunctional DnaQ family exonuclease/ATP-dependent helicase [Streptococcus vestibularis]MDB
MSEKNTNKYAIVDLEATSASSTACIIQVGIVIMQNGLVIDEFASDVNPHQELDDHIVHLTGITDQQLSQAPDFSEIARTIFELIEDCIFVAHNVKFDANLLAEALFLEGFELRTPRVDTVELAQVFYPTLEQYKLSYLSQVLNLDLAQAHTAIEDARATGQLLFHLMDKIASLPRQTIDMLLDFSDNFLFESELVIRDAVKGKPNSLSKEYVMLEESGIVLRRPLTYMSERELSKDFDTNIALLGLESRSKQEEFAKTVRRELDNTDISMVQAQTGIGKTYGYLLPLLAQEDVDKVVVAVPTKLLQNQIMSKEAKALAEVFNISFHSLKGPTNYIKLDAFYHTLLRQDSNRLINRYKMQLLVWLTETETGDLDEIKQKQRYMAYFDEIKHDGKLKADSHFADYDFWKQSYQKGQEARVVITNHAYLLTRMEDDHDFVRGKTLVIDEGQKMVLALEQFSRHQVNLTTLLQHIHRILDSDSQTLLQQRLLENLQFEVSHLIQEHQRFPQKQYNRQQLNRLLQTISELEGESDVMEMLSPLNIPLYSHFWLETDYYQEHRVTYLKASRQELLKLSSYLPSAQKVLIVSATIDIGPDVDVADLLGLSQVRKVSLPMDTLQNQAIWIDQTMPMIGVSSEEEYGEAIAKRLQKLSAMGYPILVLFTSRKSMIAVSDLLDHRKVHHLTQEKNGTAFNVKKRFDKGETNLLLGMGSFWEGADFAQQDKVIEVITRLPFDNPKDPFYQKIESLFSKQGRSTFDSYSLPMTVLRFKQAIGRSQRRPEQRSAILLMDNRPLVKSYGKLFIKEVSQEVTLRHAPFKQLKEDIQEFLEKEC